MNGKVTGKAEGEIDVKRFYIPGVVIESTCPKCGSVKQEDMGSNYLSYPIVGKPQAINFYCEETSEENSTDYCDTGWKEDVVLELNVRLK